MTREDITVLRISWLRIHFVQGQRHINPLYILVVHRVSKLWNQSMSVYEVSVEFVFFVLLVFQFHVACKYNINHPAASEDMYCQLNSFLCVTSLYKST